VFAIKLADDAELRPLEPWQAEEYLAHMDRARALVDPWIPWAAKSKDLESARATLQDYATKQATDTGRIFGIWLGGTLVGGCLFVQFDALSGNCEVGVWTEPAGEGRGLVTAAVRVLLDYALVERDLQRAQWHNSTRNVRSRAVAERVGMTLEGVLRSRFPHNGERQDSEIWSILRSEWHALRDGDGDGTRSRSGDGE
jgi:ribosomal-protein-serine acetyltransferase